MKLRSFFYNLLGLIGLSLLFAGAANATGGLDFTAVTAAIDVTTVMAAISAIAAIRIGPGFAKWAYNKVIGWFK